MKQAAIIQLLLCTKVFGMIKTDILRELMELEPNYFTAFEPVPKLPHLNVPAEIRRMIWDYASGSLQLNSTTEKYDPIRKILNSSLPYKTKGALVQTYLMTHRLFQVKLLTFPKVKALLRQMINENNADAVRLLISYIIEINCKTRLNTPLQRAAYQGSVEEVQSILQCISDVDETRDNPTTPLLIASLKGHTAIVDLLLKSGADLNKALEDEITPIYVAALEDHKDIVRLLLIAGENAYLEIGTTPLFRAAKNGETQLVGELIDAHEDINKTFQDAYIPLSEHIFLKGQNEVLSLLIKANDENNSLFNSRELLLIRDNQFHMIDLLRRPYRKNDFNEVTPLYIAAQNGHSDIVNLILKAADDKSKTNSLHKTKSLFIAASNGHIGVVKSLLNSETGVTEPHLDTSENKGVIAGHFIFILVVYRARNEADERCSWPDSPTIKSDPLFTSHSHIYMRGLKQKDLTITNCWPMLILMKTKTPLFIAAINGHDKVVKALLNTTESNIKAAFIGAAINGQTKIVRRLLNRNLDTRVKEFSLIGACTNGQIEVAKTLIAAGVDVDSEINGITSLFGACANGHFEIVQLLIDAGANKTKGFPIIEDGNGNFTALHVAAQNGHTKVVQILLKANADTAQAASGLTPLFLATINNHDEIVKLLLEVAADTEQATFFGTTPLLVASIYGNKEITRSLLQAHANPNKTLFSASLPNFDPALVCNGPLQLKISITGDVFLAVFNPKPIPSWEKQQNGSNMTSLHIAALNGHVEIVKQLLAAGADMNKTTKDNKTAFQVAAENGQSEVVKFFLAYDEKIKDEATELLHRSARDGDLKLLGYLLESGLPVDTQTDDGLTLLHTAAQSGRLDSIQFLLNKGASVLAETYEGLIPLDCAIAGDHAEAFECLRSRGSPIHILPAPNSTIYEKLEQFKNLNKVIPINMTAVSRDCERVLTGAANGEIRLWNTSSLESNRILKHTSQIIAIDISADGNLGIASFSDKKIFLLNLEKPSEPKVIELKGHSKAMRSIQISAKGERAITVGGNEIRVWDLQNKQKIRSYALGHPEPVCSAHMTPDGIHLLTNCEDGNVRYWNLAKIALSPQILPKHTSKPVSICISDDGRRAAVASLDHSIRLFDLENPEISHFVGIHDRLITSICINAAGTVLLTGSRDTTAKIWNISNLDSINCAGTLEDHTNPVTTTILTEDGKGAITGSDKTLKIWNLLNLSQPPRELWHARLITSASSNHNASKIITRSADKRVKVWVNSLARDMIIPDDLLINEEKNTPVFGIKKEIVSTIGPNPASHAGI